MGEGKGAVGIGRWRAEEPRRDGEGTECAARQGRGSVLGVGREGLGGRERDSEELIRVSSLYTTRGIRAGPTYQFRVGPGRPACWGDSSRPAHGTKPG
jgi:hypothetical protein